MNSWGARDMVMSPQCHPGATFRLMFSPANSKTGHLELQCAECKALYATIRLGR